MSVMRFFVTILFCVLSNSVFAQESDHSNRKLFIHGGGGISDESRKVFVEMAGGEKANLVVVPTATSDEYLPTIEELREIWGKFQIDKISILHTRDPLVANSPEFLAPLKDATAIWFGGGDQRRLSQAYAQTAFETEIQRLLDKGVVVGGSSAGAAIQSRVMIQGGREEPEIGLGLNLLKNSIVDQHFLERSRLNRLARAVEMFPVRTGLGISERTSLVIEGNRGRVIGPGYVIFMRRQDGKLSLQSWRSGATYDLIRNGLGKYDLPVEVSGLKEAERRFSDNDQMDDFLIEAARKSESFRQSFLTPNAREPKCNTLGRLAEKFLASYERRIEKHGQQERKPVRYSATRFRQGFEGDQYDPELGLSFSQKLSRGQFMGPWQQGDVNRTVERESSSVMAFSHASEIQGLQYRMLEPALLDREFKIVRHQYVWTGNAYGFNIVATETRDGKTREYILGYTERIEKGDLFKVLDKRPCVAISLGATTSGNIVWVTDEEVVFEERSQEGEDRIHSLLGFKYETSEERMWTTEGFQVTYQHKATELDTHVLERDNLRTFVLSIDEQRQVIDKQEKQ